MRRVLAALTVAAVAGVIAAPSAGVAAPRATELEDVFPVAPGLIREVRSWSTPGGTQRVQVLRFRLDDERVSLRPELAQGQVPGREPVHHTLTRLGADAVAGVNAGFWRSTPDGDPDGLLIQDGRYVSEPATSAGPRAAFALFADDTWAVGRPDHHGDVWFPSGRSATLFGINRAVPERQLVAMNAAYGRTTGAPAGAVEAVFDAELRPNTLATYPVLSVRDAGGPLRPGQSVLVGRDGWAAELAALEPGDRVTFDLRSSRPWDDAVHALAAGPLLVRDGARVPRDEWETEGFQHEVHNDRAHPRTLIGFRPDGEVLLVTVDGRQRGSVGITTDEAIDLALSLGAVDAVMLDGGGSTTMAVDGRITNQPCCDSPGYRWVATSLVVRSSVDTPAVDRLAGPNRFATAARIARSGWSGGSAHAFLASGSSFPDGLSAGPLAAARGAPLLLTGQDQLPEPTSDALEALGVRTVTLLGGPVAVSDAVVRRLSSMGITVERLAGPDRFATAAEVARRLPERSGTALLASGLGFADALAGVVPAHLADAPLLLTGPDALPESTRAVLRDLGIGKVVVAGGPAAVSTQVERQLRELGVTVERAAGPDRFATARALVEWAERTTGWRPTTVAIAAGGDFPDALAGGAYAAMTGTPVLLSRHDALERTVAAEAWLDAHPIERASIFGGTSALSTWIAHELQAHTEA